MQNAVEHLVTLFENGTLTRQQLIQGLLAALAPSSIGAHAPADTSTTSTFRGRSLNEESFLPWCQRALTACLPPSDPPAASGPAVPRFNTPALLEGALQQAGFVDIHISLDETELVYAQEEDWWTSLWSHATRRQLERLEAPVLARVKAAMLDKVQVFTQADGIHALFRALCAVGSKPEA